EAVDEVRAEEPGPPGDDDARRRGMDPGGGQLDDRGELGRPAVAETACGELCRPVAAKEAHVVMALVDMEALLRRQRRCQVFEAVPVDPLGAGTHRRQYLARLPRLVMAPGRE